ncbi:transposase [Streptomyces termitum]|uniref:transposase n=1 Tax=Streptomyces termitum TaxID=67368 RepID=UPI0037ABEBF6
MPGRKGGADTGPSPVDRRRAGSKHHLICDGRGIPLKAATTAADVNDVPQTLALVDGISWMPCHRSLPTRTGRRPSRRAHGGSDLRNPPRSAVARAGRSARG